jgi:homocysteine S-methyltransferase
METEMDAVKQLMNTTTPYLTDGGFETWMFFVEGFEAPEFAAIVLLDDAEARTRMRAYFDKFLGMAQAAGTGFVLDTNTWRGCPSWAPALDVSEPELLRLSRDGVAFARDIRAAWASRVNPVIVNGVVGPAGDGYHAANAPDASEAESLHAPQIGVLADGGVDMVSAITMTSSAEAIGIARAAAAQDLPSVVSFTVETDGRLPSGETLAQAIAATDDATGAAPLYYMVNCAHPDHFSEHLAGNAAWISRIGGLRANASRLSHAELDEAESLDDGNPEEFGVLHARLAAVLPGLRVVGGCCGTDHRHVGCVSRHLHRKAAA